MTRTAKTRFQITFEFDLEVDMDTAPEENERINIAFSFLTDFLATQRETEWPRPVKIVEIKPTHLFFPDEQ